MLKELFEYIIELGERQTDVEILDIDGKKYMNKKLLRFDDLQEFQADPISLSTLSGLVDYIQKNIDEHSKTLIVHILSEKAVRVYSELNHKRDRENFMVTTAVLPRLSLDSFIDIDSFNIFIQSCFVQTENTAAVLKVAGNLVDENVKRIGDDGISQEVTVRKGVTSADYTKVPNPVILAPFRTFAEVKQPESKFVFRMTDGPKAGLFEADGGVWRIEAMANIKEYLETELTGTNVKIIS